MDVIVSPASSILQEAPLRSARVACDVLMSVWPTRVQDYDAFCTATGRARLYGILFDTDSAHLRPESLPTLDEVVRLLSGEPSWFLVIEGHTDSTGTAAHNQTLSEQRAGSVKGYLTGRGIAAARLTTAGFGQSKPVADNGTELGRAQNRRVELVKK